MRKSKPEQILQGRAVSRGIAIGQIVSLHGKSRQFYRINIKEHQVEREIERLKKAVHAAKRQLSKLGLQKNKSLSESQTAIFDTHKMFLEDETLLENITNIIREQKVNAEWSVKFITDRYIAVYKDIQDEHLRERHIDLQDVAERILTALGGDERKKLKLEKNSIIAAAEVKPSTVAELNQENFVGIVAENGGWTSHSFILAREFGIPAITGIKSLTRRVRNGDTIIIDGFEGKVILNPAQEKIDLYLSKAEKKADIKTGNFQLSDKPIKTLDGKIIKIYANLDIKKGYNRAKQYGAKGIGLFRSEYLFNSSKGIPSERVQIEEYRKIAVLAGEDGVKIRTFDLNAEQILEDWGKREKNPALGLRAIRLCLSHKKVFQAQIRALIQAAYQTNLDILLPMISDVEEIREVKRIIETEKNRLAKQKIKFGNPKIGAMIEVPSAVMTVDAIAAESDFLSVGTNDLVQYLLGVDRDNESVADWFRTLHPAVLQSLKMILAAAEKHSIPAIICGEMAGSPFYAPLLIGLGATELSMNIAAMPRVLSVISNIAYEETVELVKDLSDFSTASEIETIVRKRLNEKWSYLFPPDLLPPQKR